MKIILLTRDLKLTSLLLFTIFHVTLINSPCFSQQHNTLQFSHYGFEEGLPINPIDVIFQDKQGYMWFGSQYGLCRYDGYQFQLFKHDEQNTNSLSDTHITGIAEDSKQNLWVTTYNGFNRIDPSRKSITRYSLSDLTTNQEISENIFTIYIENEDKIWLGSRPDIFLFNPRQQTIKKIALPFEKKYSKITSLIIDHFNTLWIGTDYGLYGLDIKTNEIFKHPHQTQSSVQRFEYGNQIASYLIYDIFTSKHNSVWFGTWGGGLARYDHQTKKYTRYPYNLYAENQIINQTVLSISEDSHGFIWLGTVGGLYRFNPQTNILIHDTQSEVRKNSLSANRIRAIYPERSGAMWVATDMLLHRYEPSQNPFQFLVHNPENPNSLSANQVYSMCESPDGIIWFGTHTGGLNAYNPANGNFQHYKHEPEDPKSLPDNTITALAPNPDGKIWVGNWTKGISLFDPTTGKAKRFPYTLKNHADPDGKSISGSTVRAIHLDQENNVWIGTENGDISVYHPGTERFGYYIEPFTKYDGVEYRSVYSIFQSLDGSTWVGTGSYGASYPGLGLYRFNKTEKHFDYIYMRTIPERFWNERIPDMTEDNDGHLWLATEEGLSVRNPASGDFTHYYRTDGFRGKFIYSVTIADDKTIWVSTDQFGLSQFNPETKQVKNFGLSNGLQDLRYLSGSALKAQDGSLYFGGMGGVTILPKGYLPENNDIPKVDIHTVKILDQEVSYTLNNTHSPRQLKHWQNVIQFDFVSLNYTFPEKNLYQYRLLGLSDQWNEASKSRTASYSYLPPGQYAFQVKSSNNNGVWNNTPLSYHFIIAAPFWQTLWFQFFGLVLIVASLFVFYAYRMKRAKAVNRMLANEVKKRTSLLQTNLTYLENIINTSPMMIAGFDNNAFITFINPTGLRLLGLNKNDYENKHLWEIVSDENDQDKIKDMYKQFKSHGKFENQITLKLHNTEARTISWNFINHYDENGNSKETLGFGKDVTDLIEKELLKVSNREQRRIGQEIHDSLCQTLTGIHYMCESVITERDRLSENKSTLLDKMLAHLKKATDQSRGMARSLFMVEKESQYLDRAFLSLAENIENLFGIKINLHIDEPVTMLNAGASIHIYRIVQEALSNAVKYSQSDHIELFLRKEQNSLDILIKDNGTGFNFEDNLNKGMGIGIMNYRAKIIGAELSIETQPGTGTSVSLKVPEANAITNQ